MKRILFVAVIVAGLGAPGLAQDAATMTCEAFNALDDAGRLALAPQIKTLQPVATTEPLKSQDGAELITSVTEACNQYPTASLGEALSQIVNSLKQKG